jgi:hypothetical protein
MILNDSIGVLLKFHVLEEIFFFFFFLLIKKKKKKKKKKRDFIYLLLFLFLIYHSSCSQESLGLTSVNHIQLYITFLCM